MPELPEVQTVLDTLANQIKLDTVIDIEVHYDNIVNGDVQEFKQQLLNQQFLEFHRRGKFLIFKMTSLYLIVHLRMEGKFFITEQEVQNKHVHVTVKLKSNRYLSYHDVRKFGRLEIVSNLTDSLSLNRLGLEYNDSRLTSLYLREIFSSKSIAIKTALLDQSIITGIGNIYANEILFDSKINPNTKCNQLSKAKCQRIIDSTRKILSEATTMGGTTIRSYTSSLGVTGLFQQKLMVHQQAICKICQNPITKIKINTRGTYYCQQCQKQRKKV